MNSNNFCSGWWLFQAVIVTRLYNSLMWNLDIQPVHSYISSPIGPDTLNLTIVVHFGHLPSTLRDFLAGLARVFLLLLPIHGQE
ncbi:MAG TPA: hypothetical protein VE692_01220, partial [Nitrososphaera sp.]|nr:hypothetical protein [Nitrososphaera sp.]